ncbi:c-type cytochrome biogenesis protein CcsB [Mangrovimonas sp. ST2L15]|uniref:c-type cytochrome biogenesis protein CcsB n=1 Tax=Mangrovimonas sp. ST2L15 TaxID=1645916 RepID=UPI0006B4FA06|nr:c-type cytochrome biogenesis protein CcsB [Mangrovimonas sp. ST2L15]
MQNKLAKILFSTRLTAILFIVFAAAMATGTFLDAGQDTSPTPLTRNLIYNAKWFEAIMALFVINFLGNIFRYQLHKKEKWASLLLHLAFIFILVGAGITRYFGFEGMMPIREGDTENTFFSRETYITAYIDGDFEINGQPQRRVEEEVVDFSPRMDNEFHLTTDYNGQPVTLEMTKFIGGAELDVVPNDEGESYLKVVESGGGSPHNHFLKEGEVQSIHNVLFSLNKHVDGAVNITYDQGNLQIQSPFEGEYMTMATGETGQLVKDSLQPLILRSRYVIGSMQMVFPKPVIKGTFDIVKKSTLLKGDEDGVVMKVTSNNDTKYVRLLGGQGHSGTFEQVEVGGLDIAVKYGSKIRELPFSIKLNDFIADKYPGTEKSYSAFESDVTILDEEEGDFNYRIYMNHILDHRGYRFFQSGFDPDEKGTKLSVNHDQMGTWVTYIGYFLLYLGLMATLFSRGTRFGDLGRMLKKTKEKKAKLLAALLIFISCSVFSQHTQDDGHSHTKPNREQLDSILKQHITPKEHADKFGHLVIQDLGGRMMPVNTYASEMLRKLSKYDTYKDFDANQVFLSIQESPLLWWNVPIIHLKPKKDDSIRSIIGIEKTQKYAALVDFFTERGDYKLGPYLEDAYSAGIPNAIQNELKEIDQHVNLFYNTIEGGSLRIFPVPNDENNKWISSSEYRRDGYNEKIEDSLYGNFINSGFNAYLFTLNNAKQTGDFSKADELLESFKRTQQRYGGDVMLSDKKIKAEILYNKYDIFKKLFSWYMYASSLLFIVLIVQIFKEKSRGITLSVSILKGIVLVLFGLHLAGLIVRWYVSGHAPWSDAYESMIYVSWAVMLFGLILGRKSDLTIAAAAFVTSMLLMIAHWNWMDPAIANLQPVLDSYWLMIHVAVIVASYGPFTLGAILGIVTLFLMAFTNKDNKKKMGINIQELTIINEMALTVGLVMLTIGNFLGGMWANESWGRYWGWDPKETWALISIMVYAFVIHMRLVPGLRGRFAFNLASILAFPSIIFTYLGVNFYLSGLHSYQSGQKIDSYNTIGIALGLIAILAFFAFRKYAKFYRKPSKTGNI